MAKIIVPMLVAMATIAAGPVPEPRLVVVGRGVDRASPDMATVTFALRGEGTSSDAAARALVTMQTAILQALTERIGARLIATTETLSIHAVRYADCKDEDDRPRLSTGACAIRGYVADLPATVRLTDIGAAGTVVTMATHLGARQAKVESFGLVDPDAARRRAEAVAVADGRARAEAMAKASNIRLGPLVSVEDGNADYLITHPLDVARLRNPLSPAVTVTAQKIVAVDLHPEPIETSAQMVVTYAIAP